MIKILNVRHFAKKAVTKQKYEPLVSVLDYPPEHPFSLENLPYAVYENTHIGKPHCCTRLADEIVDLAVLEKDGVFDGPLWSKLERKDYFAQPTLNDFISLGKDYHKEARQSLQNLLNKNFHDKKLTSKLEKEAFSSYDKAKLIMPIQVGDFTDFYSNKNHAMNCGVMLNPNDPLAKNWLHLPTGYHGRSSTVVISGTEIRRPKGQITKDRQTPIFSESGRLDFELELGAVIGKSNKLGNPIKMKEAADYVFGYVLLNDWSARDIQFWEMPPLGPFNAKNFATTISPWIVTTDALEPFKHKLPAQDPEPLPYLKDKNNYIYDIDLEVHIKSKWMAAHKLISKSNFKYQYWSTLQQVVHHAVSGCQLNVGDLIGSGTISGPERENLGCLLEMTKGGKEPIKLNNTEEMRFLNDGDTVTLKGFCKGDGFTVGFGKCTGTITPALKDNKYF